MVKRYPGNQPATCAANDPSPDEAAGGAIRYIPKLATVKAIVADPNTAAATLGRRCSARDATHWPAAHNAP